MHPDRVAPFPPSTAGSVHQTAHGVDHAHITQVGRDYHNHFHDGVHVTRRAVPGVAVDECPYPGLSAFGPEHARWFFGRDSAVADLLRLLDRRLETGGAQVVVAPSGAGKSSLLRAGLIPRLDDQALPGSRAWPKGVLTPTARPLEALAQRLAAMTSASPAEVFDLLVRDPAAAVPALRERGRVLLVVDQFEELFTLCPDEAQRRLFIDVLTGLAEPGAGEASLVVIGVRADFYAA